MIYVIIFESLLLIIVGLLKLYRILRKPYGTLEINETEGSLVVYITGDLDKIKKCKTVDLTIEKHK